MPRHCFKFVARKLALLDGHLAMRGRRHQPHGGQGPGGAIIADRRENPRVDVCVGLALDLPLDGWRLRGVCANASAGNASRNRSMPVLAISSEALRAVTLRGVFSTVGFRTRSFVQLVLQHFVGNRCKS